MGPVLALGKISAGTFWPALKMLPWSDLSSDLLAGGLGALVGAFAAFRLERNARRLELRQKRIEAGYRALAALSEIRDAVRFVAEEIIEPARQDGKRMWWTMKPHLVFPPLTESVDFASIAFLMCTGNVADARAVGGAVATERMYVHWHGMVKHWHDSKAEARRLQSRKPRPRGEWSDEELLDVFGYELKNSLERAAEWMPEQTDLVLDRSRAAIDDLYAALERNFSDYVFHFPNEDHRPPRH